jgi:CheY-like chemotaxis protein
MANILIVEDDPLVASTLQSLAEAEGGRVVGVAEGLAAALEITRRHRVGIALVDIQLAGFDSGLQVAAGLSNLGVRCIFVTGTAPPFPMPDFAVGCIVKPCTVDAMQAALTAAAHWPHRPQNAQPEKRGFEAY